MYAPTAKESITEVVLRIEDQNWVDASACADMEISAFFVEAGRSIKEESLNVCRACPVRKQCLTHAYDKGLSAGYFGGVSPGQRKHASLEEALTLIANDKPTA